MAKWWRTRRMPWADPRRWVAIEQNSRQLLSSFGYGVGGTLQLSEDLSYDKDGNLTQVTDLAGGPRTKTFGYDALNRLTSATAAGLWGSETYAYDPINNLVEPQLRGSSQQRFVDAPGAGGGRRRGASR